MALTKLSFSKSWTNPADFPTVETDETVIRQDMQQLHDETKDYLNGTLLPAIEAGYAPAERTVNGHALTGDVTVTKGDVGLGQVDNTADMDKPVSTAQAAAIQAAVMGQIPAGSVEKAMLAAEVAAAVGRAEEGGGLDQKIAETAAQKAALLHAAQHGASGSDPVTPSAIGAVKKTGDTMTGDLTFGTGTGVAFHSADANWSSDPWITISRQSDGSFRLSVRNNGLNRLFFFNNNTSAVRDAFRLWYYDDGSEHSATFLHDKNLEDFGVSRSKVVTYTGTGTTGVSAAVGFVPRLVVVQEVVSTSGTPATLPLVLTGAGIGLGLSYSSGDVTGFPVSVTAFGTTVSWESGSAAKANNTSGRTYRLVAIG